MQGVMIYERGNVERNKRYIELFKEAAARHGASLSVYCTDELCAGYCSGAPFVLRAGQAVGTDFVLMRCMRPLLSEHLEKMGVPVFNNARVSRVCNDKRETAAWFSARALPAVPIAFAASDTPCQPFPYPVVAKAAGGCGGRQVYLCEDEAGYRDALKKIAPDAAVVQPLLKAGGRDVRLYMLGGKVRAAMERYSDGADFRSNFGINGKARVYQADEALKKLALRAVEGLDAALVGVDFLFDEKGNVYLNEIEDAVGTRMLYQYTDIDIVEEYMALICDKLSGRTQ